MIRIALAAGLCAAALAFPALAVTPLLGQDTSATPAVVTPTAPEATVAAAPEADDPTKIICRAAAPPTGTRVRTGRSRQQICMTRGDWELLWAEAEATAREQDNPHANREFLDNPE